MSYSCPLCEAKLAVRTGLENHVWKDHEETRCCAAHRSAFSSSKSKTCAGKLDMATCATRQVFIERGLQWPPDLSSPEKNGPAVDSTEVTQ